MSAGPLAARNRRERSEPPSLPQSVLGEGQARSARERASPDAAKHLIICNAPVDAVDPPVITRATAGDHL